jgi:hypothetical protein
MPNIIMPNVIMLNIIMLNIIMPNFIMLNIIMPIVIWLTIIMLNIIMLNIIMLTIIMLSVIAPCCHLVTKMTEFSHIQDNVRSPTEEATAAETSNGVDTSVGRPTRSASVKADSSPLKKPNTKGKRSSHFCPSLIFWVKLGSNF